MYTYAYTYTYTYTYTCVYTNTYHIRACTHAPHKRQNPTVISKTPQEAKQEGSPMMLWSCARYAHTTRILCAPLTITVHELEAHSNYHFDLHSCGAAATHKAKPIPYQPEHTNTRITLPPRIGKFQNLNDEQSLAPVI